MYFDLPGQRMPMTGGRSWERGEILHRRRSARFGCKTGDATKRRASDDRASDEKGIKSRNGHDWPARESPQPLSWPIEGLVDN